MTPRLLLLFALTACAEKGDPDTAGPADGGDGSADGTDGGTDGGTDDGTDGTDGVDSADSGDSGDSGDDGTIDDADGDGTPDEEDCDPADPQVHPGAEERCNGIDDDCDASTGEDERVTVNGGSTFTSIQDAVDAAPVGAELLVCAGTWSEAVSISQDVVLIGLEGADATVIDAGRSAPAIRITGGEVSISGLSLTGGHSIGFGGGLGITGTDPVRVEDCIITGNDSSDGGGIYGSVGLDLEILDTVITENDAGIGAGIFVSSDGSSGRLVIANSLIETNIATETGGGLFLDRVPAVSISDTIIANNIAPGGGGATVQECAVTMIESPVRRNNGPDGGGGIFLFPGSGGASLDVTTSDWGDAVDDNVPDDVWVAGVGIYDEYGAAASFVCDATGCR